MVTILRRHARKLIIFTEDTLLVAAHNADSTREEAQYYDLFVFTDEIYEYFAAI